MAGNAFDVGRSSRGPLKDHHLCHLRVFYFLVAELMGVSSNGSYRSGFVRLGKLAIGCLIF